MKRRGQFQGLKFSQFERGKNHDFLCFTTTCLGFMIFGNNFQKDSFLPIFQLFTTPLTHSYAFLWRRPFRKLEFWWDLYTCSIRFKFLIKLLFIFHDAFFVIRGWGGMAASYQRRDSSFFLDFSKKTHFSQISIDFLLNMVEVSVWISLDSFIFFFYYCNVFFWHSQV